MDGMKGETCPNPSHSIEFNTRILYICIYLHEKQCTQYFLNIPKVNNKYLETINIFQDQTFYETS